MSPMHLRRLPGQRLLLLLGGLALTGFAASAILAQGDESQNRPQSPGWVSFVDPDTGLRGSLPASWHRGPASLQSGIITPRQIFTAATFRPRREPPGPGCGYLQPQEIKEVGSRGAFVTVFVGGANPTVMAHTHPRPKRFRPKWSNGSVGPVNPHAYDVIIHFRQRHRYFGIGVVIGKDAPRIVRRDARLILDHLRLGALHLNS
jgi:hypothetical protein